MTKSRLYLNPAVNEQAVYKPSKMTPYGWWKNTGSSRLNKTAFTLLASAIERLYTNKSYLQQKLFISVHYNSVQTVLGHLLVYAIRDHHHHSIWKLYNCTCLWQSWHWRKIKECANERLARGQRGYIVHHKEDKERKNAAPMIRFCCFLPDHVVIAY